MGERRAEALPQAEPLPLCVGAPPEGEGAAEAVAPSAPEGEGGAEAQGLSLIHL